MNRSKHLLGAGGLIFCMVCWGVARRGASQTPSTEPAAPKAVAEVQAKIAVVRAALHQKQWAEAQTAVAEALLLAQTRQDETGLALGYSLQAQALEGLEKDAEALAAWREAEKHWKAVGDGPLQTEALGQASLLLLQRDLGESQKLQAEVLRLGKAERIRPRAMAQTMIRLGAGRYKLHRLEEAETLWKIALAISEQNDQGSLAMAGTLYDLGIVADDQGNLKQAEDYHLRALAIFEKQDPESLGMATTLNNLGTVYHDRGNLKQAEAYHRQARTLYDKLDPASLGMAATLNNLGNIAYDQGDFKNAEEYYHQALAIRQNQAPESLGMAATLNNLGTVSYTRGNLKQANVYYRQARALYDKSAPNSLVAANNLDNLGNVAYDLHDLKEAEMLYKQALIIQEKQAPGSLDVAASLTSLGNVAYIRDDLKKVEALFKQALVIQEKQAPESMEVANSLYKLGKFFLLIKKRPADALPLLQRAANIAEIQRHNILSLDVRTLFADNKVDVFAYLLQCQLTLGHPGDAFSTLERSRARSLADHFAEGSLDFSKDVPKKLLDQQRDLDNQRHIVLAARARLDPNDSKEEPHFHDNDQQLEALKARQRQLDAAIRQASPHFANLRYPQPLDLSGVQKTLDPGTLLLAYSVADDEITLFAVTRTSLQVHKIFVTQKDFQEQVNAFHASVSDPHGHFNRALARHLYTLLLAPVQRQIDSSQRLLLCLDGPLHLLPFAALVQPAQPAQKRSERFLVEAKPLHTVVSLTVYRELRKQEENRSLPHALLAVGDPDSPQGRLRETRKQVAAIARLYAPSAIMLVGSQATKSRVLAQAGTARMVHFACHGLLDNGDPLASCLALTPEGKDDDGRLHAYDVLQSLKLHADLVVLAGCETGLGGERGLSKSEGIIGLTRAFEYAGARSVMVSMWEIEDTSSSALMEQFYSNLKAGQNKDEALQEAQLAMLQGQTRGGKKLEGWQAEWNQLFHWAAFQLQGDFR